MPPLEATYAAMRMPPWNDIIDAMLMILPRRRASISRPGELAEAEGAGEVHLEHLLPRIDAVVFGGGAVDRAGIVDQDVGRSHVGSDVGEKAVGAVRDG